MADIVNTGAAANDGSGDDLRTSFQLINQRFQQLLGTLSQITWAPGLAIEATPARQWTVVSGQAYVATSNHIAGATFADDLAAGFWLAVDVVQLIADLASAASGKGAEMVANQNGGTVQDFIDLSDGAYALASAYGVSESATATANRSALQAAIDATTAAGKTLVLSFPADILVDNTIHIYSNTKIENRGIGGIVRTTLTPDAAGKIAVLSVGDSGVFKSGVSIKGELKIQFSAALGPANTRGAGTVCFYAENLHSSHLELRCMYGEYAWLGKSNFNITGKLDSEWCHKGIALDPSVAGSAAAACTSFDMRVNMDYTIFPFVLKTVVYSRFTGFVGAIRQSYAHYAADEMSVVYTLDGCLGVNFEAMGVEAFQGMLIYNKTNPSYCRFGLKVDLSNTDKFQHDAARISNVPYAQQALISLQTVGTFDFDTTVISGSSVTVSTAGSYLIRRSADTSIMNINGGFIEPGANYTFSDRTQGINSNGARFYPTYRYTTTETRINMDGGLVWIDVTGLVTNASGEVVVAPSGIRQILMVNASVVRTIHATGNLVNIKSKDSAVQWTLVTGLGAGYSVDCKVLAVLSS